MSLVLPAKLSKSLISKGRLPTSLNLLQTSIGELSGLLADGSMTSVDLVQAYLGNIDQHNTKGVELRAIIQVAPLESVLQIAQSLDEERQRGSTRGPLHGIPILVKDNIATDVSLGMATGAGNLALRQSKVSGDATVIKRLRAAGAIILAKANMTEFANFMGPGQISGYSAAGGQCRSAFVDSHNPTGYDTSGSSSGSAVGVSAGFGAAALGTETSGSLSGPASRAALYTIRPAPGLVDSEGVIPISCTVDTVGPIGFTPEDIAILLDGMVEGVGKYLTAAQSPRINLKFGLVRKNFLDEADGRSVSGGCQNVADVVSALETALHEMRQHGAFITDCDMDVTYAEILEMKKCIVDTWASDFKEDIEHYLHFLTESPVKNLRELIHWNQKHSKEELTPKAPSQGHLQDALDAPGRDSEEYRRSLARSRDIAGTKGLDYIFNKHALDCAVFATDLGSANSFASVARYATGVAPLGYYENGVPFGILFVVRSGNEETLISILSAYRDIRPKRLTPKLLE